MKKKNLFLASFMLMLLSLFFACQKNDDVSVAEKGNEHNEPASDAGPGDADGAIGTRSISELDYADCPQLLGAVTKSAGRLVFQDEEHFEKCALCLDYQYGDKLLSF
ncbi:MAG: hypothetical protein MUC59_08845 [Saprospiraceae bacterium]|nr:hypothetical protein [Saprospiraceae bacterium]